MKKTLLLSVVASTMIMAGGDIAPVEPVVEAPVAASAWEFGGQAVAYYQTSESTLQLPKPGHNLGNSSLFDSESASGNFGVQLRATNSDVFAGVGAGVEVNALTELPFDVAGIYMQTADDQKSAGWLSQAYLTYGLNNTSIKVGRQELPKALSPFAFSEGWNVFKNTFDAALVVNSDIQDTTLVYAYVAGSNHAVNNLGSFNDISTLAGTVVAEDGVHMLTAQNKSIDGVTLTGTWYHVPDMLVTDDVNVLWGDAKFGVAGLNVGLQGGTIMGADDIGGEDTNAFGAKIGGEFGGFNASLAYSSVNDGTVGIYNLGTGVKTPLYTQMIFNQFFIASDADTVVGRVSTKALGGTVGLAYDYTDGAILGTDATYKELDLTYKTKVGENTTVFAAYVYQDDETSADTNNMLRFWARYNF